MIIRDVASRLENIVRIVQELDQPNPQVIIEARIVETTKNFLQQFGIDWGFNGSFDPALGTGTGLVFPNVAQVDGGPFSFGKGNPVLSMAFSDVLGAFDLDIALTAAESEGLARIVSAQRIVTQDNEPASIQSGVQIPIQTRVNFTTTVQYIDATLQLQVTPQITANDTVIMDISVQKVEPALGLAVAGGQNVPLLTRRAQTRLMVRDGGTTVIGGIYQATENSAQDRVPFLHKIPVIGLLFKNKDISSRHDELLIFITPKIVRGS
jgi:type IV pilus assembly protein PilQ